MTPFLDRWQLDFLAQSINICVVVYNLEDISLYRFKSKNGFRTSKLQPVPDGGIYTEIVEMLVKFRFLTEVSKEGIVSTIEVCLS